MRAWFLFGSVSGAGGIALVSVDVIEPSNFNATEELLQLEVDVSSIPALKSFSGTQTRSTAGACAAEVSRNHSRSQPNGLLLSGADFTAISAGA